MKIEQALNHEFVLKRVLGITKFNQKVWLIHFFMLNIISCSYLLRSGLKLIFHWKTQLLVNFKSLLISLAEVLTSRTTENKVVPSANNLHSLLRPFGKSLTYVKNKRGPRMEPSGTPAQMSTQDEHWLFKTTFCFLLAKKSFSILIRSPHIPFRRSF